MIIGVQVVEDVLERCRPSQGAAAARGVQAAAGVERWVGALQDVKRDCSRPDREAKKRRRRIVQPISTQVGVGVLRVGRLTSNVH